MDTAVVYDPIRPADGLRTYLDEHPAGMVAVTTHARTGLRRVVLGADAANIVDASTVAVLTFAPAACPSALPARCSPYPSPQWRLTSPPR